MLNVRAKDQKVVRSLDIDIHTELTKESHKQEVLDMTVLNSLVNKENEYILKLEIISFSIWMSAEFLMYTFCT